MIRIGLLLALVGCSGSEDGANASGVEATDGVPAAEALEPPPRVASTPACNPEVQWRLPERTVTSPAAIPTNDELERVRGRLQSVVQTYGTDPGNPWAISHALLAFGPDLTLSNGALAVDWLVSEYGEVQQVGELTGLAFPTRKGKQVIQPHADLFLKALTEQGLQPERAVTVAGRELALSALYKRSLCAFWVSASETSFGPWNDSPWTVQGLTQWAPEDLEWTADGGHAMRMDDAVDRLIGTLRDETAFMRQAMAAGQKVKKQRQGIFNYTCGGQHLLQGAIWAAARGFGSADAVATLPEELAVLDWRLDLELEILDGYIAQAPNYALILRIQRLKFLGHYLETTHKAAALGVVTLTDEQKALQARAAQELVATVDALEAMQAFDQMPQLKVQQPQAYLDLIGDSAHAIRGLDLHTGRGNVRY